MLHECYMIVTFRFCHRSQSKSLKLPVFKGFPTDLWLYRFIHISFYPLYKHYSKDAFHDVHAFDGFVCYDIPVANPKSLIRKVSPLARYDFMSDHSDGTRYGGSDTELGALKINDYKRHRVTGGVTLSLAKPFISDIRINYEKYFYRKGGIAKVSEKDKIVVEFMTKF